MRTLTASMLDALDETSYKLLLNGTLERSRVFFDVLDTSGSPGWAESSGIPDNPIMQDVTVSDSGVFATFYNYGGTLQYQIAGSSILVNTTISIKGKPGVFEDHLFYVSSGSLYHQVLDWTAIAAHQASIFVSGGSIFSGYSGSPGIAVHGVSAVGCIVFEEDDGGFRVHYHNTSSDSYDQPGRFMFPKAFQYYDETDGESERTMQSLIMSSCATQIGTEVFAYISNCSVGSVEGIVLSLVSLSFSDIFIAIPSELSASMCEFRCNNAYVVDGAVYIVGQFIRHENAEGYTPYSLISKSTNGRNFSVDPNTLVSVQGYRLLGYCRNDVLYVGGCNRTAFDDATYYFLGSSGSPGPQAVDINDIDIVGFSDSSEASAQTQLRAGNHALMFHDFMAAGSRIKINAGYETSLGDELIPFGSYLINGFSGHIEDGARSLSPQLVNESEGKLSSMSSPFYTQIISKSSVIDPLTDLSNMYVAPNTGLSETSFSVDFWDCEKYDNVAEGITGVSPILKGGVSFWTLNGSHKVGVKTKDLDSYYGIEKFPKVVSTSVVFKIYGWSADHSGSANDYVGLVLFMKSSGSGGDYVKIIDNTGKFPCTYLNAASGTLPIEYTVSDMIVDDEISAIGVYFEASNSTRAYISRVDVVSGVSIYRDTYWSNTPWKTTLDSGIEIPGTNFARIMFSTKPYNAFNFMLHARFTCTITGNVAALPCGFGLVGLAEDGSNYVVGRYNLSSGLLEIAKVRDRVETVLTSGSPGTTIGQDCDMLFTHRDGNFAISILDNGSWVEELTYEWQADDGWMFTSDIGSMHCGIYGIIRQPYFYTTGLDISSEEDIDNSEAVPFMPGLDADVLDDFPTSGTIVIDGYKYTYNGKYKHSSIRGPFQFRNNDDGTGPSYVSPYGTGQPGLECLDLDWTATDGTFTDYIIAIDSGGCYICVDTQWQIWITTDGSPVDIPDRARYMGGNVIIGEVHYDLSNRVYLTGGLLDPHLTEGTSVIHSLGSLVELDHAGSLWCSFFEASSGDADVTVEDLIDRISRTCDAVAGFPGDVLSSSQTYSGSGVLLATKTSVPGFDVRFTVPTLSNSNYVDLISDTQARGYTGCDQTFIRFQRNSNGVYEVGFYALSPETLISSYVFDATDQPHKIRILYHDNFATVYLDELWIYTFGISSVKNDEDPIHDIHGIIYSDTMTLVLNSNVNPITVTDIRICELADWREAVYIDLETDGKSAIQSVIQERPVEVNHKADGSIDYTYEPTRSEINIVSTTIRSHDFSKNSPQNVGSDAIIYYMDVKTYQYLDFASRFGLSTKVIRMPNLEQGALKAAKISLKRSLEQSEMHRIIMRPDLRIEPGDIINIAYTTTGAIKVWSISLIVESVDFKTSYNSLNSMEVSGRLVI